MGYYWLNQRGAEESNYRDVEGEVYHYRSSVPGSKQLSEGDWFVYYRPGEYVLFGAGRIGEIEEVGQMEEANNSIAAQVQTNVPETRSITEYHAHIREYHPFESKVNVRDIKDEISFLRDRQGLNGVPQNSIYSISTDDFFTMIKAADIEDWISPSQD